MNIINKIKIVSWSSAAVLALGCGSEDGAGPGDEEPPPMEPPPPPSASCAGESDCGAGLACLAGSCRTCSGHDQCSSDVCDRDAATPRGFGACVAEARVLYVDADTRPACLTGDGSRGNPLCGIRDAMPLVGPSKDVIRVYPGLYLPFLVSGQTVRVFGPADGTAIVGEEDIGAAVRITSEARVVLDGLDFGVSVRNGVNCQGSALKVVRGSAQGDLSGIVSSDCRLAVDRMRVGGLLRSGITIAGTGSYAITNSYFRGGDIQAVVFTGSASGMFWFNTVAGGGEISPGGIDCGAGPRRIQDSIVFGNFAAAGGAQTVGGCVHQRVVVGTMDTRTDPGLIRLDPDLDAEGRLLDNAENAACCIDRGARVPGLDHDFFGTPRPQGPTNDIGAHELVRAGS